MNIIKSSIWVSLISLSISVISFLNQTILARFFGTGLKMDYYLKLLKIDEFSFFVKKIYLAFRPKKAKI